MSDKSWLDNLTIGSDDCEQGRHNQCTQCSCTCHPLHVLPSDKAQTLLTDYGTMGSDWSM